MIGLGGAHRIDPETLPSRVQERDARQAADDRTDVQKWLGDPARNRSALVCGKKKLATSPPLSFCRPCCVGGHASGMS
jgi:hypothetical protein